MLSSETLKGQIIMLDIKKMFEDVQTMAPHPYQGITGLLKMAHDTGAVSPGNPCSVCKEQKGMIRTHFHGSEFNSCARKIFYGLRQPEATSSSSSNESFLFDGHTHEMLMLRAISKGFEKLEYPFNVQRANHLSELHYEISKGVEIIGHYDGILEDLQSGRKYVLECKAVKDATWAEVLGDKISPTWIGQMQFYMLATGITQAVLCVKNRTSSIVKFKLFEFIEKFCFERMRILLDVYNKIATNSEELPERAYTKRTYKECLYCPFSDECWGK